MPEIWLRYGGTEVVLDIKAENLLDYVIAETEQMNEEQVRSMLDTVSTAGPAQVIVLDDSPLLTGVAPMLVESLARRGIGIGGVCAPQSMLGAYRNALQANGLQPGRIPEDPSGFSNTIFLSLTGFDALFGFTGAPVRLLRHFGGELMLDAYATRSGDLPSPGQATKPLTAAYNFAEKFDATSVEVIAGSRGIADMAIDKPVKAHQAATGKLESTSRAEVERSRSCIVSPGNVQSTLSNALRTLWNCTDVVREDGNVTLLAECRDGFGSAALEMFIEGKLGGKDLRSPKKYIDGLEDLLYLEEAKKKYDLMMVTSLPDYYAKDVLGFRTFRKIRDALHHILNTHGLRSKVLVVSDAGRVLLKAAAKEA